MLMKIVCPNCGARVDINRPHPPPPAKVPPAKEVTVRNKSLGGAIVGGLLGGAMGGPLGALIGAGLLSGDGTTRRELRGFQERTTTPCYRCSAKIVATAYSDGRIDLDISSY